MNNLPYFDYKYRKMQDNLLNRIVVSSCLRNRIVVSSCLLNKIVVSSWEGVVGVTFAEAEEADTCRDALNGRWFACRQLRAETWDGKTKYFVEETEEEYKARLKKWEDFLEGKSPNSSGDAVLPPKPVRQNTDSEVPVQTDQKPAANTS